MARKLMPMLLTVIGKEHFRILEVVLSESLGRLRQNTHELIIINELLSMVLVRGVTSKCKRCHAAQFALCLK